MPLTDAQRQERAQRQYEKARMHLGEAEAMDDVPNAQMHSAYYAMHHAACAALLMSGGIGRYRDVPQSHDHVVEHYGKLVAHDNELGASGMALNRAKTYRVVADYDLDTNVETSQALDVTRDARTMLDTVLGRWPSLRKV